MAIAFYLVIYFIDWPFIFAPDSIPSCVLAAKAYFLQRRGQKIWAERKKGLKLWSYNTRQTRKLTIFLLAVFRTI
jgi:hypothetical protein